MHTVPATVVVPAVPPAGGSYENFKDARRARERTTPRERTKSRERSAARGRALL